MTSIFLFLFLVLLFCQSSINTLSLHSNSQESNDENGIDLDLRLGPSPVRKKDTNKEIYRHEITSNHQHQQPLYFIPQDKVENSAEDKRNYRSFLKTTNQEKLQQMYKRRNDKRIEKIENINETAKTKIKIRRNEMNRKSYHIRKLNLRLGKGKYREHAILQLKEKVKDQTATPEEIAMVHQINKATERGAKRKRQN